MFKKFIVVFSLLAFVGCAAIDLSKIDTKQAADVIQRVLDQLDKNKQNPPQPSVPPKPPEPPIPPKPTEPVVGAIQLPEVKDNQIFIINFDQIPDFMRAAGFGPARDTVLWYVLFSTYGNHFWPGNDYANDPDSATLVKLDASRDKVQTWYSDYINRVGLFLKANPTIKATILLNDGNDKGGCFMGVPIQTQLNAMGLSNQIDMGFLYEYK
jgi:hypothetical protein